MSQMQEIIQRHCAVKYVLSSAPVSVDPMMTLVAQVIVSDVEHEVRSQTKQLVPPAPRVEVALR